MSLAQVIEKHNKTECCRTHRNQITAQKPFILPEATQAKHDKTKLLAMQEEAITERNCLAQRSLRITGARLISNTVAHDKIDTTTPKYRARVSTERQPGRATTKALRWYQGVNAKWRAMNENAVSHRKESLWRIERVCCSKETDQDAGKPKHE